MVRCLLLLLFPHILKKKHVLHSQEQSSRFDFNFSSNIGKRFLFLLCKNPWLPRNVVSAGKEFPKTVSLSLSNRVEVNRGCVHEFGLDVIWMQCYFSLLFAQDDKNVVQSPQFISRTQRMPGPTLCVVSFSPDVTGVMLIGNCKLLP